MSHFLRLASAAALLTLTLYNCTPTVVTPVVSPQVHLAAGNPTNATTSGQNNYLLEKPQYVMSYNNALRHANWVSWELSAKWIGAMERANDFRPDPDLPASFYKVQTSDYTGSGFDRGHLCPSADRTRNMVDNSATFLMSNIVPQSPDLNRNAWANLESYCRRLSDAGYLLYIVAGTYGTGGVGSAGAANQIKNGVNVPARMYKVILATQKYSISELDSKTIVIAADFPNSDDVVKNRDWVRFITTPAAIERAADVAFFQKVNATLRSNLKERLFDYEKAGVTVETPCKKWNDRQVFIGTEGGCYYYNATGGKVYTDKKNCDCL